MSQIEDFLSGKLPAAGSSQIDDFLSGKQIKRPTPKAPGSATAGDWLHAGSQAVGEGILAAQGGIGTFLQAPGAYLESAFHGGAAALNRGVSRLTGGAVPIDEGVQQTARDFSRAAMVARKENVAAEDGTWLNPATAAARIGLGLQLDANQRIREIEEENRARNPELVRQQQNIAQAEGFVGTLGALKDNPLGFGYTLARSAPDMIAGLGIARTAATATMREGAVAAEKAAASVAAAGGNAAAQKAAADAVLEQAQRNAVANASAAGAAAEGASSAYNAREGVYREVMDIPQARLETAPRYREVLAQVGGDRARAREILANELADQATLLSGASTVAGSMLTRRLLGGDTTAQAVAGVKPLTLGQVGRNVLEEGFEEGVQGMGEDAAQFLASSQADPSKKFDLGGTLAQNIAAGAVMGAGGTGGKYAYERARDLSQSPPSGAAPTPPSAPETPPIEPTAPAGAAASTAPPPAAGASIRPTAADEEDARKLMTPVSMTALDRVPQIDTEAEQLNTRLAALNDPANGYGQMFDQERAEIEARRAALQQERDAITAGWPQATLGAPASFSTETGSRLAGQYALMDADALTTSHDVILREDPRYPKELQPRDRTRAASEIQVSGIVSRLDPARLGVSADSANGAPIVGADGLVESGNARTIALKRIYQANGQKAEDYKAFLRANAAQFGLTPEAVDGMGRPVLVRVRQTPVNRAEFARQANVTTVQRMSPSEQALSDAKRLTTLEGLAPDDEGNFTASYDFIRQFMAMLPATEQSDMLEADGKLSTAGYRRIQNAVLAKAYGDSPALRRMTESLDDNLRNVSKALVRVAPTIADARERMNAGTLHQADIAGELVSAVEGLSSLKDKGWRVADELAQADLTGPKYSTEAGELLTFLSDNIRSPRRMAEFVQRYYEALAESGDPSQASMFGDAPAPSRMSLIEQARGGINAGQADRGGAQAAAAGGQQSEGAQRGGDGARGDAAGSTGDTRLSRADNRGAKDADWVAFPESSRTLGIPRAQMPQVKVSDRPELLQRLAGRGIANTRAEVAADTLRPTQAEFSPGKVARWGGSAEGDRSVLVSSDGYILDGHHQWLAARAAGEPVSAVRFNAPIRELLDAVKAFPIARRSPGANVIDLAQLRAAAAQDFNDALADLAAIASRNTRAALMPEDTPNLMPTLVKLFGAAIRMVGTDLKRATRWVKDQLKADPQFKKVWNRIADETYRKAAMQALEGMDAPAPGGLFDSPAAATQTVQGGLFDAVPEQPAKAADQPRTEGGRNEEGQGRRQEALLTNAPADAMIDGRPYDPKRDNFALPHVNTFLDKAVIDEANGNVEKYYKNRPPVSIPPEDRARAEALLAPLMEKAAADKVAYDQKVIDIAKRVGALGQMIAPLKSMDRAAEKLVLEEGFNVGGMKDTLRSTIVVGSYDDVQAVLDEIVREFKLLRDPKNRTGGKPLTLDGRSIPADDPARYGGYSDVMVNIVMPSGVIAEIQINVPEMLGAKEGPDGKAPGHKLYEAYREAPKESPLGQEILGKMLGYYAAAFAAAKNSASVRSNQVPGPRESSNGRGSNAAPSSDNANQRPSGNSTTNPPSLRSPNLQPSGNLSGNFIAPPPAGSVPQKPENEYTGAQVRGDGDANAQPGQSGNQGQGAGPVSATQRPRRAESVRGGSRRGDQRAGRDADAGTADAGGLGQARPDGVRGQNENGNESEQRAGAGADAGVPAGRDIPVKSGRNYRFGPDDLTYAGTWLQKATANVEAVELLKALEKEGRQATREEQQKLAQFIGWGASEIANSIFGDKIKKKEAAVRAWQRVLAARAEGLTRLDRRANDYWTIAQPLIEARTMRYGDDLYLADLTASKFNVSGSDVKYLDLSDRLASALTKEEFAEASRSTQYAHYTSKAIVRAMWAAMERMGFKGGTVLEPGAGIGIFQGLMPEAVAVNSAYTGIEFDSVTGGILKQLMPDERILVESFVDSRLPKDFYDVAIGNPPFSGSKILGDPEYAKRAFSLHDYFFAKSIDRVKPGGLVMYVTSRYTMDKLDDKARAYLNERADLVGAIRLPQTAFQENAGTEVVTDVIFLRKKVPGETWDGAQSCAKSVPMKVGGASFPINEYFHAHPDMVLGSHSDTGKMRATTEPQYTVTPREGDIEAHFAAAVATLPEGIYKAARGSAAEAAQVREIDFNPKAKKEGNYYVTDAGALMVREGGVGQRVELRNPKDVELIKDFVPLRDALKQAHYDQLNDLDWRTSLTALRSAYDAFVKKHDQINQFTLRVKKTQEVDPDTGEKFVDESSVRHFTLLSKLKDDPDVTLVAALEEINDDTGQIKPSAFLSERVLGKPADARVNSPMDALLSSLNDIGKVDIDLIAQRVGLAPAETIAELGTAIYNDPEAGWVMADEYLSGNVKRKLNLAREAAKSDKRYERNVIALEAVQPAARQPSQINIGLGMNWIPSEVYADFVRELAGVRATVAWSQATKQWIVTEQSGGSTLQATADWGTNRRNITELLEHGLTGRPIQIAEKTSDGKTITATAAIEAANLKLEALKERFKAWVWENPERTDMLVKLFNDQFNTTVPRSFDGRHLTLPGTSKTFDVFPHVKRGAWRIIQKGNTYLAHAVGSGKTFQMVISAMEQKRLGLIKKPMVVVPNHMLQQFAHEWQMLYPAARLMVADENNFHTDNRRRFVSRVALSDLDGVVITHSAFKLLDLDPAFKRGMIEQQLEVMRAALEQADEADGKAGRKSPRIKQIEKQIENMEQKLEEAMSSEGKDRNVRFDELGVDFLYVDEAHAYRKLDFITTRQVKGLSPAGSAMSFDLWMKARYLDEKKPGRSLVMASGTPVTNTLAELYTVQKFMAPQTLEDRNIIDFDSWAAMFGRERTELEPNAAGKYEPVTRFSKFVNVPELIQSFRDFADVLTADNLAALLGDKRPKVEGGQRQMIVTPKTDEYKAYQRELAERVKISKAWKPSREQPNNPDPMIRIIGDGRLAAIDMRFVDPKAKSDPDSKLNKMIDDVIRVFKETADMEYADKKTGEVEPNKGAAMMVFSDLGFGAGVTESRGFNARGWFAKRLRDAGVPADQVAFMSDYKKSADKLKLFKDVNAGRVRILIGSSKNMGTGVNAQQRLKALFHLDSPWFPADLEQREGRIVRQGNKNPLVQIFAYATKGTYDENMWKMLATKQYFIDQAMSGDDNLREIEDLDSQSQFDIAAGLVAEDPRILQLAGVRAEIDKLNRLYQAHEDQRARFRQQYQMAQMVVESTERRLPEAVQAAEQVVDLSGDKFRAKAMGRSFDERAKWGESLIAALKDLTAKVETKKTRVGEISGFPVYFIGETVAGTYSGRIVLDVPSPVTLVLSTEADLFSAMGLAMRAQNAVADVGRQPARMRERIVESRAQMDAVGTRLEAVFPLAGMLADKRKEAAELEAAIEADSKERDFWVERKDTRTGHTAKATSAADAIERAVKTNGGTPDNWTATEEKNKPDATGETRLSRGTASSAVGMPVKTLEALRDRIAAKMPNMPHVHVLADPGKAPKALREYIIRQDAWNDVEGAMHNGELYLFASGLSDELRAEHVLAEHEAAHVGLRAVLGDSLPTAMSLIYAHNQSIRRAVSDLQRRGNLSRAEAVEEAIVDIPTKELLASLGGWRKVVVMARDWLGDHGFDQMAQKLTAWLDGSMSDIQRADLFVADLVKAARDYVAGKRAGRRLGTPGNIRLSGNRLADDIRKQERWLMAEARARGFKDIEDLLARNYPLFEKLAAKWLEKNPADTLLSRARDAYAEAVQKWQDAMARAPQANNPLAPAGQYFVMPMPTVYAAMGLKQTKLSLPVRYLQGIREKHADIPVGLFRDLPRLLSDPVVVIPHVDGGYRAMVDARTDKGEPIVVGIGDDGRVQTVTPIHNEKGESGTDKFASMLEKELAKPGAKVYARNKEALTKARASRGVAMETLNPNRATPTAAVPAISALHRSPRDHAILIYRDGVIKRKGDFGPGIRLSRATPAMTAAERADEIISRKAGSRAPLDALSRTLTRVTGIDRLTGAIYRRAGYLLDRYTPEQIKAGVISDYGVPEAVIDQRAMMQGRQRVQLRKAGALVDKLSTLTRAESRVAYEWMNMDGSDPQAYLSMMQGLPEESVAVLQDVQKMIDQLSQEAVALGQLDPEAFKRNRFAYLRRSYAKHVLEQTAGEKAKRQRVISILGDQYRRRGMSESATMKQLKAVAPDWWNRKLVAGQADTQLKGEKFVRLERRTIEVNGREVRYYKKHSKMVGSDRRGAMLDTATREIDGLPAAEQRTKLREVVYIPVSAEIPLQYRDWDNAGTFEVTNVKGENVILYRDWTKDEREAMGEIDEARFAIARTLHGMVHDVEVGRYLDWLARTQAKLEGQSIPGTVVEASERYRDTFKPDEWVKVPDTKLPGTAVLKYGKLAGRYVPGPVWNDLRQVVNGQFKPLGETYAQILSMWKTSKTALSPAVHMNNIMSNFVMADWHDVGATHIAKALRILLAANEGKGAGAIAAAGRAAARVGNADREAAREILNRYKDSGGDIGAWATQEISRDQLDPLLASLEAELAATAGASVQAQVGVMSALQHALMLRLPSAWEALKGSKPGKIVGNEAGSLIDLYQSEDDIFRLAAWLKAKEEGRDDLTAGKVSRKSFLDYHVNAPWIQAMRNTGWPFIAFTYRAVPMFLNTIGTKPHKILKLMALAGTLNALGGLLAGGGDEERALLPEEKAGRIWGMVPKLIRMPWNDANGSAVYLDIRRFIPVGDVLDVGQGHSAIPILPGLQPGGPLALIAELVVNRSMFTGKSITLETDTAAEKAGKVIDYLYKAFAPNILGLPNTYATTAVMESASGKTDAFGREQSTAQAVASSFGVKLGSYPADVLRLNLQRKAQVEIMEIDRVITGLKRQHQTNRMDADEFAEKVVAHQEKKAKVVKELQDKLNAR